MRFRLAAAALVLAGLIMIAGCTPKDVYFFSFRQEQDLENSEGEWVSEEDDFTFNESGINLQEANICSPLRFCGDFTMTVKFLLETDDAHEYYFGVSLGDGTWYGTTENDLHVEVDNCGGTGEYWEICDHDQDETTFWHYEEDGRLPGLNRNGLNTWVLKKLGNRITIRVNGIQFASFVLEEYDSVWFGPNIYCEYVDGRDASYGMTVESVKVEYNGVTSPMPVLGDGTIL